MGYQSLCESKIYQEFKNAIFIIWKSLNLQFSPDHLLYNKTKRLQPCEQFSDDVPMQRSRHIGVTVITGFRLVNCDFSENSNISDVAFNYTEVPENQANVDTSCKPKYAVQCELYLNLINIMSFCQYTVFHTFIWPTQLIYNLPELSDDVNALKSLTWVFSQSFPSIRHNVGIRH